MKHKDLIIEKEQEKLYHIHHMHHYLDGAKIIHELHHCFLFEKKNMQGDKFCIEHQIIDRQLYHVLDRKSPNKLFDHANNAFKIEKLTNQDRNYFFIA